MSVHGIRYMAKYQFKKKRYVYGKYIYSLPLPLFFLPANSKEDVSACGALFLEFLHREDQEELLLFDSRGMRAAGRVHSI